MALLGPLCRIFKLVADSGHLPVGRIHLTRLSLYRVRADKHWLRSRYLSYLPPQLRSFGEAMFPFAYEWELALLDFCFEDAIKRGLYPDTSPATWTAATQKSNHPLSSGAYILTYDEL